MAEFLLSDADVAAFIDTGYHLVTPQATPDLLHAICAGTDALHDPDKPAVDATNSNDLFRQVPEFDELLKAPSVHFSHSALISLAFFTHFPSIFLLAFLSLTFLPGFLSHLSHQSFLREIQGALTSLVGERWCHISLTFL